MSAGALFSAESMLEDRLHALAPEVRRKYRAIEHQAEQAADEARRAFDSWQEAHQRLVKARADHAAAVALHARNAQRRPGVESPHVQAAAAVLARYEERAAQRLAERERTAQASDVLALLHAMRESILNTDPAALQPIVATPSPGRTSSNPMAELARVRETLATLITELQALVRAPVPLAEASERLDRYLDQLAMEYEPPVNYFVTADYRPPVPSDLMPFKLEPLWASIPAWRDVLHERLSATYATLPASVPTADRPSVAASLAERRRTLELEEERLIVGASAEGIQLARRSDAAPMVVLCMVLHDA